jgi:hypothetical protein
MLGPLLDALSHIHSKGFAHSHIKPSNIMAIGKQLKLSSDTVLPLGEPRLAYRPLDAYDPPEAATAAVADSSDVWSLGVTLVEVLTQQAPVPSPESQADPIIPSTIPQPFLEIARNCLRRDPLQRWTTAQIADYLNPAPIQVAAPEVAATAQALAPTSTSVASALDAEAKRMTLDEVVAPKPTASKAVEPAVMWGDIHYCWVVLCKNYFFHMRQNLFFRHRIPLAFTDPFSPVPEVENPFHVRCDDCGKTYVYRRSEIRRYEGEVPKFTPHPLF